MLNIHASLLPRWRGAAPIIHALMNGDEETGITIMQMDEGLDTGDIIIKEELAISNKITFTELHDISELFLLIFIIYDRISTESNLAALCA